MSIYPDLYVNQQDNNKDDDASLLGDDQQPKQKCYSNSDDWDFHEHSKNNRKANCSLFIAIISVIFGLWPLCIVSCCMIRKLKNRMGNWHRHWCKVSTAYYLSIFGIAFGLLEWAFGIFLLWKRFHH